MFTSIKIPKEWSSWQKLECIVTVHRIRSWLCTSATHTIMWKSLENPTGSQSVRLFYFWVYKSRFRVIGSGGHLKQYLQLLYEDSWVPGNPSRSVMMNQSEWDVISISRQTPDNLNRSLKCCPSLYKKLLCWNISLGIKLPNSEYTEPSCPIQNMLANT